MQHFAAAGKHNDTSYSGRPEAFQAAAKRLHEIQERLKIIRTRRRLLSLKNPEPTRAVQIEIAEYDVEEAELEPQLRRAEENCYVNDTSNVENRLCQHTSTAKPQVQAVPQDLLEPWQYGDSDLACDGLSDFDFGFSGVNEQPTRGLNQMDEFNNVVDWTTDNCLGVQFEDSGTLMPYDLQLGDSTTWANSVLECTYMNNHMQLVDHPGVSWSVVQVSNDLLDSGDYTHKDMDPPDTQVTMFRPSCVEDTPHLPLQESRNSQAPLVMSDRSRKRPRQDNEIPGTYSFFSRPPAKRTRRPMTEQEQKATNEVRQSRACLRCRISKIRCDGGSPCKNCRNLLSARLTTHNLATALQTSCLRLFTDVDPFSYLRSSSLGYLAHQQPRFLPMATGRPSEYSTMKAFERLSLIDVVFSRDRACNGGIANVNISWTIFASQILEGLDFYMKRKDFWGNKSLLALLLAVSDQLMSLCLELALHIRHIKASLVSLSHYDTAEQLIYRLLFCVQRILCFRDLLRPKLGLTKTKFLGESATELLDLCSTAYPTVHGHLRDIRAHDRYDYSGTTSCNSKELFLVQAASLSSTELIRHALRSGALPAQALNPQDQGRPVIFKVIENRDRTNMEILLDAGAKLSSKDQANRDVFDVAGRMVSLSVVQLLLDEAFRGLKIVSRLQFTKSPGLHQPRWFQHNRSKGISPDWAMRMVQCIKHLFKAQTNLHVVDTKGRNMLHYACGIFPSVELAEKLISAGVNLNARDNAGRTPLHVLWQNGFDGPYQLIFGKLCMARADVNVRGRPWCKSYAFLEKDAFNGAWADSHTMRSNGETLLHWAAKRGIFEIVEKLLQVGAEVDARDKYEQTPLQVAARQRRHQISKLLLEHGAQVDSQDRLGNTALHVLLNSLPRNGACCEGLKDTFDVLVNAGANINAVTHDGLSTLHVAFIADCEEQMVEEASSSLRRPRPFASHKNRTSLGDPENLIDPTDPWDLTGSTASTKASDSLSLTRPPSLTEDLQDHLKIPIFLAGSADPDFQAGKMTETIDPPARLRAATSKPCCIAVWIQLIDFLLTHGAGANVKDSIGRTPLHYAASWVCQSDFGNDNEHISKGCEVVSTLLKRGADPTERCKCRLTPLMLATKVFTGHGWPTEVAHSILKMLMYLEGDVEVLKWCHRRLMTSILPSTASKPAEQRSTTTSPAQSGITHRVSDRGRKQLSSDKSSKVFVCTVCSRHFTRHENLKRHHRSVHQIHLSDIDSLYSGTVRSSQHQETRRADIVDIDMLTQPANQPLQLPPIKVVNGGEAGLSRLGMGLSIDKSWVQQLFPSWFDAIEPSDTLPQDNMEVSMTVDDDNGRSEASRVLL